jgi:RNA polymerase sigma-70 factor (ECF subfamily)
LSEQDARRIIEEHAPFVWRVLRHVGAPEEQLEDLTQEVFLVILRQAASFEARSSLQTWIYGICWNVASAARRRTRARQEAALSQAPEPAAATDLDRDLWLKQAHGALVAALATLDDDARTVFVLYELSDVSLSEIARGLGVPKSTCHARLQLAREKVEAFLRRSTLRAATKLAKAAT